MISMKLVTWMFHPTEICLRLGMYNLIAQWEHCPLSKLQMTSCCTATYYWILFQDVEPSNYDINIMGGRSSEAFVPTITPLVREHSEAKDKLRALKDKLLGRKSMSSKNSDDSWNCISTGDGDWNGEIYSNPIATEIEAPDVDITGPEKYFRAQQAFLFHSNLSN